MPSPIGHSLAGYVIYVGTTKRQKYNRKILFMFILIANFPDLDFIPGFLLDTPNRFHHGISHSIGVAGIFGIILGLFVNKFRIDGIFLKSAVIFAGLYFSHIFLDFFARDITPPYGEKLFWPITGDYYISPVNVFLDIRRSLSSNTEFIMTLFRLHNVLAIFVELILILPMLGLIHLLQRKKYV